MAANQNIQFGLGSVVTTPLRFFVRTTTETEREQIDIRISSKFQHNKNEETVSVQLQIIYKSLAATSETEDLLVLEIMCTVKTNGLFEQLPDDGELPEGVLASVLGVALGTARGMIKVQAAGYEVGQMELPVINPSDLISGKLAKQGPND